MTGGEAGTGLHIRFGDRVDGPYSESQLRQAVSGLPPGVEVWVSGRWASIADGLDSLDAGRVEGGSHGDAADPRTSAGANPPAYAPGDVVNGHMFTGVSWVPVQHVLAALTAPQPSPVQPAPAALGAHAPSDGAWHDQGAGDRQTGRVMPMKERRTSVFGQVFLALVAFSVVAFFVLMVLDGQAREAEAGRNFDQFYEQNYGSGR
jgi:hypothetical protein